MHQNNDLIKKATVIGLGQMGSTLASLLLSNGYRVSIWNRTKSKAAQLIKNGAVLTDLVSTIEASPIIIICVFDYEASKQIFAAPGASAALRDKIIIQLTTGSPADAVESEVWAKEQGALYLDGAIQVAPDQMASPDTTIFISGEEAGYAASESILKVFGGNIKYLGNKISSAAAMDLASLSYLYGSLLGFFHAARICEVEGFRLDEFGEIIKEITPGFSEFVRYEAGVIQSNNFAITQSPLSISVEATERILHSSKAYGINTDVPALAVRFLKEAKMEGYENEELASLIKVFRK